MDLDSAPRILDSEARFPYERAVRIQDQSSKIYIHTRGFLVEVGSWRLSLHMDSAVRSAGSPGRGLGAPLDSGGWILVCGRLGVCAEGSGDPWILDFGICGCRIGRF